MFDTKRKRSVEPREVHFCRLCGAEIAQLHFANGHPYWTNVRKDLNSGSRYVVIGEGNHYNFKPEHNCVRQAEYDLSIAEMNYEDFISKHTAAKATIAGLDATDTALAGNHQADEQLLAALKRLRENAEASFKTLDAQKASQDQHINWLRTNLELLRQDKSIIPANQVAVGRTVRVVKGRKVPKGVEATVYWMGLDNYSEGIRLGIEQKTSGQKWFIDAANVEIIQP